MTIHAPEIVPINALSRHPRNYRQHPQDQIDHLAYSIKEYGQYRNIVCANDWTILAGHGVWEACQVAELVEVAAVRLPYDPLSPEALKILALDNTVEHLAVDDDRALSELLKELKDLDPVAGLLGTGYDDMMLANLVFVTRPGGEVADMDAAAKWVGLPGFEPGKPAILLMVHFDTPDDREAALKQLGVDTISKKIRETWSVWWPPRERQDLSSVQFQDESEELAEGDETLDLDKLV